MMKKIFFILAMLGLSFQAMAIDPFAPKDNYKLGFLLVTTPQNGIDTITATNSTSGQSYTFKSGEQQHIAIGNYQLSIKLQNTTLTQSAVVVATERTDVTIVGYGNFKVNAPDNVKIELISKSGKNIGSFEPNKIHTVATGNYDVKINGKGWKLSENIDVVINTTREVDVKN